MNKICTATQFLLFVVVVNFWSEPGINEKESVKNCFKINGRILYIIYRVCECGKREWAEIGWNLVRFVCL